MPSKWAGREKMAEVVYALCMMASFTCAWFLLRGYRRFKTQLLLYCGLCFIGLAMNNFLLFLDVVVIPRISIPENVHLSLTSWRTLPALAGIMVFIYGVLKETLFTGRRED